jgi:hypothetical protein
MFDKVYKALEGRYEKMFDENGKVIEKFSMLKAIGIGTVEGVLDGCMVLGIVTAIGLGAACAFGYSLKIIKG